MRRDDDGTTTGWESAITSDDLAGIATGCVGEWVVDSGAGRGDVICVSGVASIGVCWSCFCSFGRDDELAVSSRRAVCISDNTDSSLLSLAAVGVVKAVRSTFSCVVSASLSRARRFWLVHTLHLHKPEQAGHTNVSGEIIHF